jgi:large subunit ribosomal protein L17
MPKALEVRAMAEKLITLARTGTLNARRRVIATLQDRRLVDEDQDFIEEGPTRTVVQKLFNDIAPTMIDRSGGYTRIIKTAEHRIGDGGDIVQLQLVTVESTPKGTARRSAGLRRRRNERKHQFASKVLKRSKEGGEKAPEKAAETAAGEEAK